MMEMGHWKSDSETFSAINQDKIRTGTELWRLSAEVDQKSTNGRFIA
jgi:hypothetical protein